MLNQKIRLLLSCLLALVVIHTIVFALNLRDNAVAPTHQSQLGAVPNSVTICPSQARGHLWRRLGKHVMVLMAFDEDAAVYANLSAAVNLRYAERHDMSFKVYPDRASLPHFPSHWRPHWMRYLAMLQVMEENASLAAVLYLDADNFLVETARDVRDWFPDMLSDEWWLLGNEIVPHWKRRWFSIFDERPFPARYRGTGGFELNSGVQVVVNHPWTRALLRRILGLVHDDVPSQNWTAVCHGAHTEQQETFGRNPKSQPRFTFFDQACLDHVLGDNANGARDHMRVMRDVQSDCFDAGDDGSPVHALAGYPDTERTRVLSGILDQVGRPWWKPRFLNVYGPCMFPLSWGARMKKSAKCMWPARDPLTSV